MKFLITLTILTLSLSSFAQKTEVYVYGEGGARTFQLLTKQADKDIKGSVYYDDQWRNGKIILFSGEEIRNYEMRYDLKKNLFEIKLDNSIKLLSTGGIKEVHWKTKMGVEETLISTIHFPNYEEPGFFTLLSEGQKSLLKKTYLKIIDPNYVNALDIGDEDKKQVKRDKYFMADGNKVVEIKKNKKKILKLFNSKSENVKKYADDKHLNFKDDYDLIEIFNYYNNL